MQVYWDTRLVNQTYKKRDKLLLHMFSMVVFAIAQTQDVSALAGMVPTEMTDQFGDVTTHAQSIVSQLPELQQQLSLPTPASSNDIRPTEIPKAKSSSSPKTTEGAIISASSIGHASVVLQVVSFLLQ